ncbi:MAG: DUF664 domain-containing protein [Acidimicrobiales bacterium]|jgi:uncharacterized damage-inducible protein DinB
MAQPFPEPVEPASSRSEVLLRYLDYFRSSILEKLGDLPESERRRSRLPSGWSPLELVKHLTYVEVRWLEWGFEGRAVDDPWGDRRDGRWFVADSESSEEVAGALRRRGDQTRVLVETTPLDQVGRPGPRWDGAEPPTLERVLHHLVQEYARHLGHLDIVTELAGGPLGE